MYTQILLRINKKQQKQNSSMKTNLNTHTLKEIKKKKSQQNLTHSRCTIKKACKQASEQTNKQINCMCVWAGNSIFCIQRKIIIKCLSFTSTTLTRSNFQCSCDLERHAQQYELGAHSFYRYIKITFHRVFLCRILL